MTLHVPALPAGVEPNVTDAAAHALAARRRERIETTITVAATLAAVLIVSIANVALELGR